MSGKREKTKKRERMVLTLCDREQGATIKEITESLGVSPSTAGKFVRAVDGIKSTKIICKVGSPTNVFFTGDETRAIEARLKMTTAYYRIVRSDGDEAKEVIKRLVPELMQITGVTMKQIAELFGCTTPTLRELLRK